MRIGSARFERERQTVKTGMDWNDRPKSGFCGSERCGGQRRCARTNTVVRLTTTRCPKGHDSEMNRFLGPRAEPNRFGFYRSGEMNGRNSTISLSRAQSRTRSSCVGARNGRKKFNVFPHLWSYTLPAKPNKNPFLRPTFVSRTSPRILPKFAFALDIFISLTAF